MTDDAQVPQHVGPDFVATRRQDMITVEIEAEAIVYDEQQEVAHLLSPTAAIVWELLDGRSRLDEVAVDLAQAFDVAAELVLQDVVTLVQEFSRQGLLARSSTTSAETKCTSPP
ncbi:MAG TPA: PqqD family protein [Acidimicrobiales bacterium]